MIDGRDDRGRFTEGNAGGPGNPYGGKIARFRAALFEAASDDDLRAIVAGLDSMRTGD